MHFDDFLKLCRLVRGIKVLSALIVTLSQSGSQVLE